MASMPVLPMTTKKKRSGVQSGKSTAIPPASESMRKDKPLVFIAKCANCGKGKNQHQAGTLKCPKGKREVTGYKAFGSERWSEKNGS